MNWKYYQNIWIRNIIIFIVVIAICTLQYSQQPSLPGIEIPKIQEFIFIIFINYWCIFFFNTLMLNRLFFQKKYIPFFLFLPFYILLITFINMELNKNIVFKMPFLGEMLTTLLTLIIGTAFYITHKWIKTNFAETHLKLYNKESELLFLKQQLSPHFLFNALNNLYGTSLVSPEIVSDKILELSDLLRYQVRSTTKNFEKIGDEIQFIKNYFQYITFKSNNIRINESIIGDMENVYIPTLLILPLVENAVKFSQEMNASVIIVKWKFVPNEVLFYIENDCQTIGSKKGEGTKVGLVNIKKRLELLNISHELKIDTNTPNKYKIELKLWNLPTNV
jgi:sensor histidine kinase YesM